jgi:hypothetical protein
VPDGSFAIARADDRTVEVATDDVGSRSVFYALTDRLFVASSSQRAVVAALGAFRLSPEAVSWVLSAGALGPESGWDERILRLAGGSRVRLDREAWKLVREDRPVLFEDARLDDAEHAARLADALRGVCADLDLGPGDWRLPLSGGYDSRALLLCLAHRIPVRCVTWGLASSLDDPRSDAHVARALAQRLGVPHEYFPMDGEHVPVELMFERFLANGDGCVDHIGAYTDGFEIWRQLHARGVAGVIRGDEGCGWEPVVLPTDVRRVVGATMLGDFLPRRRVEALGLAEQRWPAALAQQPGESVATWRDRLYHSYRIPFVLAPLTDLKAAYVEVVNPLLSRRILQVVRGLPDRLRTEKRLFREVVEAISPPVPFATRRAIATLRLLVHGDGFLELARRELQAGRDEGSLPPALVEHLVAKLPRAGSAAARAESAGGDEVAPARRLTTAVRRALPRAVHSALRAVRPRPPATAALAFRAAIVSRMARTLSRAADAQS